MSPAVQLPTAWVGTHVSQRVSDALQSAAVGVRQWVQCRTLRASSLVVVVVVKLSSLSSLSSLSVLCRVLSTLPLSLYGPTVAPCITTQLLPVPPLSYL